MVSIASSFVLGCASYPAPTQHMADALAAERSARELGAANQPQGQLHLKLAQEQIAEARNLLARGDHERADFVLSRAKADAELALALAREQGARVEAQRAIEQANTVLSTSANQGVQ
jgi:hypothetical protein